MDKVEKGTRALFEFSALSFEIIYAFVQFAVSFVMLVYFSGSSGYAMAVMIVLDDFGDGAIRSHSGAAI